MYVCGNPQGIHSFFSWLQLRGISVRAVQVTVDVRGYLSVLQSVSHLTLMWSHVARQIVRRNRRTLRSLHIATIMYVCMRCIRHNNLHYYNNVCKEVRMHICIYGTVCTIYE